MNNTEVLEEKTAIDQIVEKEARRKEALAALERLRKLTEDLPPVDAVAIVREMRDAAPARFE